MSVFRVFLVRIFPDLDWIQSDTEYLSVFSPNWGKIRTRITPNTDIFHAVLKIKLIAFHRISWCWTLLDTIERFSKISSQWATDYLIWKCIRGWYSAKVSSCVHCHIINVKFYKNIKVSNICKYSCAYIT